MLPEVGGDVVFSVGAGGGVEGYGFAFVRLLLADFDFGAGRGVVEDGYCDAVGGSSAGGVGYCELKAELGVGVDLGGGEGGDCGFSVAYAGFGSSGLLPKVADDVAVGVCAGGGVEGALFAFVELLLGDGVGAGRGVVEDGDAYLDAFAGAGGVGYCELEDKLGVGVDFGGGEGGDRGFRVFYAGFEPSGLLPKVANDVAFGVCAGGGVESAFFAFVELLLGAGAGLGRGVVEDADGDVGCAAFAEAVGYCQSEDELGVGFDLGGGEGGLGAVGVAEIDTVAAAVDLSPGVFEVVVFGIAAGGGVELS